jgi:hypothetical protein
MVYYPSLYLALNNYGYSDQNIAQVKEYLRTRKLPDSLDNSGKKIFSKMGEGFQDCE